MQPLVRGDARLVDSTLTVTGVAPTEQAVAQVETELAKAGQGVNAVSQVTGPPEWVAHLADGKLTFSGRAPTSSAQKNIVTAAAASFRGTVTDQTNVGIAGAFAARAVAAMPQFTQFKSGEMAAQGRRFIISGEAPESALTYLKEDMKRVVDVYAVDYQVKVLAPALPELKDVNLDKGSPNLKADCQAAFGKVMAANKILFATGTATITRQSGEALDKVAEVARRCSDFKLEVQGYTDNKGKQPANLRLSQSRAEAVRAWMQDKGVPADRLSARGFGSDNPIASNAKENGRAQNRRIEFKVSG
jgi:OOP family OmpA-OmpF porin